MQDNQTNQQTPKPRWKILLRAVVLLLAVSALIFGSAGRLNYWQGWLFVTTFVVVFVVAFSLFSDKKDLLYERIKPGPGIKWWDKIFFALYIPALIALFTVSALDAGRFRWTTSLPASVYVVGYLVLILSHSVLLWAMWTNRFFSSTVRIQTDRGHYVIQTGPYRFVRHPGYLAGLFWMISAPIVLGSLYGLVPASFVIVLLIVRTYLEDTTLKKELTGYADYAKKVPARLLPHIW
jgi:protein-S-isoprenylcysteine O-methyltransferase Ste14